MFFIGGGFRAAVFEEGGRKERLLNSREEVVLIPLCDEIEGFQCINSDVTAIEFPLFKIGMIASVPNSLSLV